MKYTEVNTTLGDHMFKICIAQLLIMEEAPYRCSKLKPLLLAKL